VKEQEPPEEDPDLIPKEYSFNPLEASRNITAGNFYFKKGNYRAASRRYVEASKWDPSSGEALLKLAEADEKLRDFAGAREAYTKYLAMPDIKDADAVKKRLAKLPASRTKK
jgi:tetratricopeptide (TPR) repeat protein